MSISINVFSILWCTDCGFIQYLFLTPYASINILFQNFLRIITVRRYVFDNIIFYLRRIIFIKFQNKH
jgi:hypothetical protein